MQAPDTKKYNYDFSFHGCTLAEFMADKKRKYSKKKKNAENEFDTTSKYGYTEKWIKAFIYIFYWHLDPKNKNKVFFISSKTMLKSLNKLGVDITARGLEYALQCMKKEKLITVKYGVYEGKENTLKSQVLNPNKWHHREIRIVWKTAYKIFSVFDLKRSEFFNETKAKSRIRKLIRKRPFSYTKQLSHIWEEMKKENETPYSTSKELFRAFVHLNSREYYDVEKYLKNQIPSAEIDTQKEEDLRALEFVAEVKNRKSTSAPPTTYGKQHNVKPTQDWVDEYYERIETGFTTL